MHLGIVFDWMNGLRPINHIPKSPKHKRRSSCSLKSSRANERWFSTTTRLRHWLLWAEVCFEAKVMLGNDVAFSKLLHWTRTSPHGLWNISFGCTVWSISADANTIFHVHWPLNRRFAINRSTLFFNHNWSKPLHSPIKKDKEFVDRLHGQAITLLSLCWIELSFVNKRKLNKAPTLK